MTIADLFFSPKGRIGRLAFFLGGVSQAVVGGIVLAMVAASGGAGPLPWLCLPVLLGLIYVGWMLNIKRAHDLDKSAMWLVRNLIMFPMIGGGFAVAGKLFASSGSAGSGLLLSLIALATNIGTIVCVVKLAFFSGTDGVNRFGPPSDLLRQALNDDGASYGAPIQAASGPLARLQKMETPAPAAATAPRPVVARGVLPKAKPSGFGRRGLSPA